MTRSLKVSQDYIEFVKSALMRNEFARQIDLAEALGISRDTVSRFFNGRPVGYLNFYEICHRLGLDLEKIADYSTDENDGVISTSTPLQNLPHRHYSQLIGRETEIKQLLEFISPGYRQHITIVQGIGGLGKTSLVIEAAYRCWEAKQNSANADPDIPIFDAIIFTSAKDTDLLPFGVIQRPVKEVSLQDIFKTIARVFNKKDISKISNEKQIELVYNSLNKQPTLLIVDNMETIKGKDREDILGFLNNLPSNVQSVITTREKVWLYSPIDLSSLSEEHSIELIQEQAKIKNIELNIDESQRLFDRHGGVPLALIYLVGQIAGQYSLQKLLDSSRSFPEDVAGFCFEESVRPLRKQPAHFLLMSLAIFRTKPEWKALAKVAGLEREPLKMEQGLEKLKQLSLVNQEEDKYKILPITREYALTELAKFPSFEQEARERWIEYYLEFTEKYGGKDWKNWRAQYDALEADWSNIVQVLDWCAAKKPYDKQVIKIWKKVDNYIDLKGDWDYRLKWWQWFEKQSSQGQDWSIYIDALAAQAWILILKGYKYFEKAFEKIEFAWKITDTKPAIYEAKANLGIVHSVLLKAEKKHRESINKLQEVENLIEKANLEETIRLRYLTRVAYYKAEVFNCKNNPHQQPEQAKVLYEQVCQQGETIGWSRFVNYARNGLANIAIEEQSYHKAEQLIKQGLPEAELWRESTRIGHWVASSWRLAVSQNNLEQAKRYAIEALNYFDQGEIQVEDAQEIRDWSKRNQILYE